MRAHLLECYIALHPARRQNIRKVIVFVAAKDATIDVLWHVCTVYSAWQIVRNIWWQCQTVSTAAFLLSQLQQ